MWETDGISSFMTRVKRRMLFFLNLKSCDYADLLFFQVQLQEAERRWEEVQSYIRKRTAEHEAAQQGKGEVFM